MLLAIMIGQAARNAPYTVHNSSPQMNMPYIAVEMSAAERVRQTRSTCGTKDKVVQLAAA